MRSYLLAVGMATLAFGAIPTLASAEDDHRVRRGETWSGIAKRHGTTPGALAAANRKTVDTALREGATLRVPSRGELFVGPGDSLIELAKKHDATAEELARANGLKRTTQLRAGQLLVLPGAHPDDAVAEKRWGKPKRPGVVTFHRLFPSETRRITLLDQRGRVRRNALDLLTKLMRPKNSKKRHEPHARLIRLIGQVSDHFGGRPLHIISGFRVAGGNTKETSKHVAGHAMDFRIPGVPLDVLRAYCSRLSRVGVGYYPRSNFVHLDVRTTDARWTDWSLPGEPALKRKPGDQTPEGEAAAVESMAQPEAEGEAPEDDGSADLSDEP
jgi:uncharacterized protein YcbK (DUF882 family)